MAGSGYIRSLDHLWGQDARSHLRTNQTQGQNKQVYSLNEAGSPVSLLLTLNTGTQ